MTRTADVTTLSDEVLAAVLAAVPVERCEHMGLSRKRVHAQTRYPLSRLTVGQALTVLVQRGLVAYEERPNGSSPGRLYYRAA